MELELRLEKQELALLILHMNIMRKSVKKGFKANYGLLEGRKKIKVFDDIKDKLNDGYDDVMDIFIYTFTADEIDMLSSFMNFYVQELKLATEGENEILEHLERVKDKVLALDELVTDEVLNQCL